MWISLDFSFEKDMTLCCFGFMKLFPSLSLPDDNESDTRSAQMHFKLEDLWKESLPNGTGKTQENKQRRTEKNYDIH